MRPFFARHQRALRNRRFRTFRRNYASWAIGRTAPAPRSPLRKHATPFPLPQGRSVRPLLLWRPLMTEPAMAMAAAASLGVAASLPGVDGNALIGAFAGATLFVV